MRKSKSDIEQMREERDYWKRLALQRKNEIESLKLKLERAAIWEDAFAGGVRPKIEGSIEQLQIERNRYKRELDETIAENNRLRELNRKMHNIEHAIIPPLLGAAANHISLSMGYRTSENAADFFKMDVDYPGTQEEFEGEVYPQIMAALGRTPTLLDLGKQNIPGLSTEEFLKVLAHLTPYWYLESLKPEFNNQRLEIFNYLYPQIDEAEQLGSGRERNGLRTAFNNAVEDTFKRSEKRQKNALSMAKVDT